MISPIKIANIFKIHNDWIDFEPETLWVTLRKEIGVSKDKDLSEEYKNMISAVKVCVATDRPYKEWDIFENTALALNGEIPVTDIIQEIHFAEIVLAVTVMNLLAKHKWSDDVKMYMAAIAHKDGFVALPESMKFISQELLELTKAPRSMRVLIKNKYSKWVNANKPSPINENSFVDVGCGKLWNIRQYLRSKLGSSYVS